MTTAFFVVGVFGAALAFLFREPHYFLLGGAAVLLPAWWAVESWLGLHLREPYESSRTFWAQQFVMIATVVAVFTFNLLSRGGKWEWDSFDFVAVMVLAVLIHAIYTWRDVRSRRLGIFPAHRSRISASAIIHHLLGYAAALVGGFVAAAHVDDWSLRITAYIGAALVAKFVVDLLTAPSPPLEDASQTRALTRMAVLSPLLWGLPWGLLIVGYFIAMDSRGFFIEHLFAENRIFLVLNIAIATTFIFAAATSIVFVSEPAVDKNWATQTPTPDGALRPVDWAMLYWAVLAGAAALLTIVFTPREPSDEQLFGVEKWTCAKQNDMWMLAWLSRSDGLKIKVGGYIAMSDVSCVPNKDGKSCKNDGEGWEEVEFVVHGNDGFDTTVKFDRKSKNVQTIFRNDADVYGDLANEIVVAMSNGKSADITVRASRGRVLYTKHMDLKGYDNALKRCTAQWRREYELEQAREKAKK